jgi:hypothetical protein
MPKMVCVKCKTFYHPKRNGVVVNEQMPTNGRAEPGTRDEAAWKPYKVWHADLWECRSCGHQVVSGFPPQAMAEHFQDRFAEALTHVTHTVNDCP